MNHSTTLRNGINLLFITFLILVKIKKPLPSKYGERHSSTLSLRSKLLGFIALLKLRSQLLLITTVPTMIVAEEGLPSVWLIIATLFGGTLAAGGANAINMYIDRDIDKLMERTKIDPSNRSSHLNRSIVIRNCN